MIAAPQILPRVAASERDFDVERHFTERYGRA
jgi:hypothetical protein